MQKELLNSYYLSADDLMKILGIGKSTAMKIVNEIQEEMKQKKYLIPKSRKKVVLTKLVKRKYGL